MSSINFTKTFGAASVNASTSNNNQQQKPKAQFWINVGYLTDVKDDNGELRFVSLGSGIPLDTIETLPTNSKNVIFGQFQAARNNLRDQLVEAAKTLAPGSAEYIGDTSGICVQLRRVSEETEVSVAEGENPFARKLFVPVAPAPAAQPAA